MAKPIREMEDAELLSFYRAVKRGGIILCDESAVKRYKLALKDECARRGILSVGEGGEDQNFQKPSAEIFKLGVRLSSVEIFEQEAQSLQATG